MLSYFSRVQLCVIIWTVVHRAHLSMRFFRQEYWSGLPGPPPGDLPDPETEPTSPVAPTFYVDSLPLSHWGSPLDKKEIITFRWWQFICGCVRSEQKHSSPDFWTSEMTGFVIYIQEKYNYMHYSYVNKTLRGKLLLFLKLPLDGMQILFLQSRFYYFSDC